ncbi:MAG: protein phosphatase 2C domain-containing protein [Planctomycetaceae bacterium]
MGAAYSVQQFDDLGFRRQNNEDSLSVRLLKDKELWKSHGHLFIVADGMGGHAVGELASKIAVDSVPHNYYKSLPSGVPNEELRNAIISANAAIYERSSANHEFQRMGTTCSSLVLGPHGAIVGHVGDSRVYRVRGERIDQLTADHSLEWELQKEAKGDVDPSLFSRSRHVITRSLGPERVVEVDIEGPYPILPGDVYIVCSDGLTGHLSDDEIGMICRELDSGEACKLMVNLANLRGGVDNISVVVAEVGDDLPDSKTSSPSTTGNQLNTPIQISFLTMMVSFTATAILAFLQKWGPASLLLGFSGLNTLITYLLWSRQRELRKRALEPDKPAPNDASTIVWRPYRTASAVLSLSFIKQLDAIIDELIRTAQQDKWHVNWNKVDAELIEARAELNQKSLATALSKYAELVQRFMTALKKHRSGE